MGFWAKFFFLDVGDTINSGGVGITVYGYRTRVRVYAKGLSSFLSAYNPVCSRPDVF